MLNIQFLKKQGQIIAKNQQTKIDIWALEGVPQYIKTYIEQIKNFNGDFIEVFK